MSRSLLGSITSGRILFFILLLICISNSASADLASNLISTARTRDLAHHVGWLRLLHYENGFFGGSSSPVQGAFFFLSPNGAEDPEAELEATLRGFFKQEELASLMKVKGAKTSKENPSALKTQPGQPEAQSPQCQFPARLIWLEKELGFSEKDLPQQDCSRYRRWMKNVQAKSVTLIFSSYYLNNPSSAFGHTFLRLNKAVGAREGRGAELLDYGINYAANPDTGNAALYAFKGLFGFFPGTFTSVPYYYKVREYNDYESRDLWEYDLKFTPEQTAFLAAHLWEIGSSYFQYYYLSKNCSYEILALLDVVDSQLHLVDGLSEIVIPADTIKVLNREPGLVTGIHYRPSVRTLFDYRLSQLTDRGLESLSGLLDASQRENHPDFEAALTRFGNSSVPSSEKVAVLDAAADYVDQHFSAELIDSTGKKEGSQARIRKQSFLLARSAIPEASPEIQVPPPLNEMPQVGHGSRRVSLDSGMSDRFGSFSTLDYRFALHDLADPANGYPGYAQIEMVNVRVRYQSRPSNFWVDDVTAFKIISLNPLKTFNHQISWMVNLQAKRFYDGICNGTCFGPSLEVGGGYSVNLSEKAPFTAYLFSTGEFIASSTFPGAHFRPGIGPTFGFRFHPSENLGVALQSGYRYRFLSGPHDASFAQLVTRWAFRPELALEGQVSQYFTQLVEGSLGVSYYY
jgi:hypothetical protein